MGMLIKLIKAAIGAFLLNKTARYAILAALQRFAGYVFRPGTASKMASFASGPGRAAAGSAWSNLLSSLLRGAAELLLLRFASKGGFSIAGVLSALVALMLAMRKEKGQTEARKREKEQIIDLDDYTILEER